MVCVIYSEKLVWKLDYDGGMFVSGVGMVMRKMGNAATPTVEITLEDGTYTLKTVTTFKTTEIKFKLGEEFEETTADGRTVKVRKDYGGGGAGDKNR